MRKNRFPQSYVVDRYGRRLDPGDNIVPDGATVRVPMPFMDSLSARTSRAFMRDGGYSPLVLDLMGNPAGNRPGYAIPADAYEDYEPPEYDTEDASDDPREQARQDYIRRMSEAWKTEAYAKQHRLSPGGLPRSTGSMDPETAYQQYKDRLSNAWRTERLPNNLSHDTEDNVEGASTSDLPEDIAELPLEQQHAYCQAYNQYLEENPDADEEDCESAGREALGNRTDSADYEEIRTAAQRRYVQRITNAWKTV
jgi:hypothetical protein